MKLTQVIIGTALRLRRWISGRWKKRLSQYSNLRGADLINADLRGADLTGANLSGADLSGATCPNGIVHGEPGADC